MSTPASSVENTSRVRRRLVCREGIEGEGREGGVRKGRGGEERRGQGGRGGREGGRGGEERWGDHATSVHTVFSDWVRR